MFAEDIVKKFLEFNQYTAINKKLYTVIFIKSREEYAVIQDNWVFWTNGRKDFYQKLSKENIVAKLKNDFSDLELLDFQDLEADGSTELKESSRTNKLDEVTSAIMKMFPGAKIIEETILEPELSDDVTAYKGWFEVSVFDKQNVAERHQIINYAWLNIDREIEEGKLIKGSDEYKLIVGYYKNALYRLLSET